MKKTISLLLTIIFIFSLFSGCSKEPDVQQNLSETKEFTFKVNSNMPTFKCTVFFSDKNKNKTEKIEISDKETGENIQTIIPPENEIFTKLPVYFKDITFDENLSIIIPIEMTSDKRGLKNLCLDAYIWDNDAYKFIEVPSFKNVISPVINKSEKTILSRTFEEKNQAYYIFTFDNNQFVADKSLYWEIKDPDNDENIARLVEKNKEEIVSDFDIYISSNNILDEIEYCNSNMEPYFKEGSLWDIKNDKWESSFLSSCKETDDNISNSGEEESDNTSQLSADTEPDNSLKPSDEEVSELFKKAIEIIYFHTETSDFDIIKNEFPNAEIYSEEIIGESMRIGSYRTSLNYNEVKEKYSTIFTKTALASFIDYNFNYKDGALFISGWPEAGYETKLEKIEIEYVGYKNGNYNYKVSYTGVTNFEDGRQWPFEDETPLSISKTENGYKVANIDPLMYQCLLINKRS